MKKTFKKVLSAVLSLAMVLTSVTVYDAAVKAEGETVAEMVASADFNLALHKDVTSGYKAWSGTEGKIENLTSGDINGPRVYPQAQTDGWYQIDLGDYYTPESIDRVVSVYNETNGETWPSKAGGYYIQYSKDGINYVEARHVTGLTLPDASPYVDEQDLQDVTVDLDSVRYVRVFYPDKYTWGVQIKQLAVLNVNGDAQTAEVAKCTDAAAVTVSSPENGVIKFNVIAGENQENYTYSVYLDSSAKAAITGCVAGQDYTITGVDSGEHTIRVVSHCVGMAQSDGIVSEPVVVRTIIDSVTDPEVNLGYQKDWVLLDADLTESKNSTEGTGDITDGVIGTSTSAYVTTVKGEQNKEARAYYTVDLGTEYVASGLDSVYVWYRSTTGGTWPEKGGYEIQYSSDNVDFTTVAVISQDEFNSQRKAQGRAPFSVAADVSAQEEASTVRYVRIYYPEAVNYGAQVTEIAVFDTDKDATEAGGIPEVEIPASVTATSPAYNTVEVVVEAPQGHEDYTFEVKLGDEIKTANAGEKVIFTGVISGTYTVIAKSVDAQGNKSKAVTSNEVTVEDAFNYSTEAMPEGKVLPDTNENGNNYVRFEGVSATASSGDAKQVIDNNGGTRWESGASDPQYIIVDFKNVYNVKEIAATWEGANSKDFTVEVSTDGKDFAVAAKVVGAASGERYDRIVLKDAVEARYVKINGTARNLTYGHSIWEMAVYGPDAEVEAPTDPTEEVEGQGVTIPDVSEDQWTVLSAKSESGATASILTSTYDELLGDKGNCGFYPAQGVQNWNNITEYAIYNVPTFGFVATGGNPTDIIIQDITDGNSSKAIKYTGALSKKNSKVVIASNCVYIAQELLSAGVGEIKYYAITASGTATDTFVVRVAGAPIVNYYNVTVDGTATEVAEGEVFKLGDAKYGYYSDGKMYKAGTEITVTSDMQFASVNELSVTMKNGAGIRYIGTAGIRFESAITSDNMTAVADQNVIKEGTLITAQDIYEANGSQLSLTSPGTKINVVNQGWYKDKEGSYCGSICNIVESNYIREFTAVAYVTIEYTDGTSTTVYSNKGSVRSISQIASAIKADGYRNIEEQYHSVIDSFIR